MTLRDSLVKAIESWQKAPKDRKLALLDQYAGLGPTPEEETLLTGLYQAVHIPNNEWVCLCVIAKGLREREAHDTLEGEAEAQIQEAEADLLLTADDYLHFPWKQMDEDIGGMGPGTVHILVCPSKGGKTTLCLSAAEAWCRQGKKVLYGGFEMKAKTLRTMFAALAVGLDPGDILSGKWKHWLDYDSWHDKMAEAYTDQRKAGHWYQNLRFTSFETVGVKEVNEMMSLAHEWGADVVLLDHLDHVEVEKRSETEASNAALRLVLKLTKRYGLRTIGTSQTNQMGKQFDRFRDHRPAREEHVKYGSVKKEVATTMTSVYRPVKIGLTKEEKERVEAGELEISQVLLTGANAYSIIANRNYGSHLGRKGYVGWERGRIVEPSAGLLREIEAAKNRIRTARGE